MSTEPLSRSENKSDIAIISPYEQLAVGESLTLYEGLLEIRGENHVVSGDGQITLRLRGDPHIAFLLSTSDMADGFIGVNILQAAHKSIVIPELGCSGEVLVQTMYSAGGISNSNTSARGFLQGEGLEISKQTAAGNPEPLGRVRFHLLNFPTYLGTHINHIGQQNRYDSRGRVTFQFGKWTVTLDGLRNSAERLREAEAEHGYKFTHVGMLRRTDDKLFSSEQAKKAIEVLGWFFSFVRGARCTCVLPEGYRYLDESLWQLWQEPDTDTARHCGTWFSEQRPHVCFNAIQRFYECWKDDAKQKWLRLGIGLYCASNQGGRGVELQLAESQIALELLTCVAFLEENSLMSEKAFEGLSAADKVRVLLFWLKVPTSIPSKYDQLNRTSNGEDAPEMITRLRNTIFHPTKSNRATRANISDEAIYQAWQLNMWYIELAILKLIGHSGPYTNRSTLRISGEVDTLPWTEAHPQT